MSKRFETDLLNLPSGAVALRHASVVVILTASLACAGNPARSYSAPAPVDALSCALRTAAGLGYNPIQGGIADGYIKLDRRTGAGAGRAAAAMVPGVGSPRIGDYITVTGAGTALRINLVGYDKDAKPTEPGGEAVGHVEAIMSACANPGTHRLGEG